MGVTNEQFEGGVFHSALEGGRSGARVALTSSAVLATTPEGQLFTVEYAGADLSLGGASGKMWFCRSPDREVTIFSEAPGFADALRRAAAHDLVERLDIIEHAARDAVQRYLWLLSGIAIAIALVVTGAVYAARNAGQLAARSLPEAVDRQVGKFALENMELGGSISTDAVLNDAVKQVLQRLNSVRRTRFRFETRIVDSPTANAFALPGGPIVIYTGLLREAKDPDQLAGVLAHEMAHVTRRHGMQRIAQSLGVVAAIQLMFGDVSGVMAIAVELLRAGAINSYSREQERQADMDAVERMWAARLDAQALAGFFRVLAAKEGSTPKILVWFGTHPDLQERIRAIRSRVNQRHEQELQPLPLDWDLVRRHAGADLDASH